MLGFIVFGLSMGFHRGQIEDDDKALINWMMDDPWITIKL